MIEFVVNLGLLAADQAVQSCKHIYDFAETQDIPGILQHVAEEATKCTVESVNHVHDFIQSRGQDIREMLGHATETAKSWMADVVDLMKEMWSAVEESFRATSSDWGASTTERTTQKRYTRDSRPRAGAKAGVTTASKPRTRKHKGKKFYKS